MTRKPQIGMRQFPMVRYYLTAGKILLVSAAVVNGALGAFFVILYRDKH